MLPKWNRARTAPLVRGSYACAIVALACLAGCNAARRGSDVATQPAAPASAQKSSAAVTAAKAAVQSYGSALVATAPVELGALLATPARYAAQQVTVEGVARKVCQARGCWLELATGMQDDAQGCRVVMKGHAFFVPTDSAGRRVRVQGQADVQIIPVAQVAHMEQEGAHFAHKAPDGSAQELRIIASGVELLAPAGS